MSEYASELREQWPCAFSEQPLDLHAGFVVGANVIARTKEWSLADSSEPHGPLYEADKDVCNELNLIRAKSISMVQSKDPWDIEHAAFIRRHIRRAVNATYPTAPPKVPLPEGLSSPDIQYDVVEWMAAASDEHLLSFLDWNERRLRPIQAHLVERTARMHPFILQDIKERLVATDLLPASVFTDNLLENAMQATMVHAMDSFQIPGAAGYFSPGSDTPPVIGVLDECVDNGELYRILFHEYIHSIGLYVQTLQQFYGKDPDLIATVLNEAFVEHLTVAGMHGSPNLITPHLRGYQGVYHSERDFMASITEACNLKLSELGRAYCEPIDSSEYVTYHDALSQEASNKSARLFPEQLPLYIGGVIAKQYNTASSSTQRRADLAAWTQEIAKRSGAAAIPTQRADISLALENAATWDPRSYR